MIATTSTVISETKAAIKHPSTYCFNCERKLGTPGVTLFNDARGYKCCNFCKARGLMIAKRKMTKLEKRKLTKMKLEMRNVKDIKHITLDAKGNLVK